MTKALPNNLEQLIQEADETIKQRDQASVVAGRECYLYTLYGIE
jgi:hypothetical protein